MSARGREDRDGGDTGLPGVRTQSAVLAPRAIPGAYATYAPAAASKDAIHLWQPLLSRMIVGTLFNAAACATLVIAGWGTDWAEQPGDVLVRTWRGPFLLPRLVTMVVLLLLRPGGNDQRPRGARRRTTREWRQKWRQNRRDFGVRGAFKPVPWGVARTVLAALVWAGVAGVVIANVQHLRSLTGVEIGAAPWIALATTPLGALGCLSCMPVSRLRMVKVDSDGNYYGTEGGS